MAPNPVPAVANSICSTPQYPGFSQLRSFPPAVTWCQAYIKAPTKPPAIPTCPNGNALCALLANLVKTTAPDVLSTACSCIAAGPSITVSVPKTSSTVPKTTPATPKSSSTQSLKTSSSQSSSPSKISTTPIPSTTPSVISIPTTTTPSATTTGPPPVCQTPDTSASTCTQIPASNFLYDQFYNHPYFIEGDDNPGNHVAGSPALNTTIPEGIAACDAANQCATFAASKGYQSFQLYYTCFTNVWECVAYPGLQNGQGYFNQPYNPNVLVVLGFSTNYPGF